MELHTFIADSAPEAVAQIRHQLGPEAVVVNVRKLPAEGLSRLWQKPRIEVLAFRPEPPAPVEVPANSLTALRQELAAIKQQMGTNLSKPEPPFNQAKGTQSPAVAPEIDRKTVGEPEPPALNLNYPRLPGEQAAASFERGTNLLGGSDFSAVRGGQLELDGVGTARNVESAPRGSAQPNAVRVSNRIPVPWRVGAVLESTGLLPLHAQRVVETLSSRHAKTPPENLAQEIQLARDVLIESWRTSETPDPNAAHLFIGAPGSGKTTCLCQWLAQVTLVQGRPARVWRLDGQTANNAESLSVYAEILDVPLERFVPDEPPSAAELLFIDLPGVNWSASEPLQQLADQVARLPKAQIHLVLNAAYETSLLFAQIRAFAALAITDLIFTHLDEEPRWGKLWNFVLGTNYTIGCLSAGQNVPGDFHPASPTDILARQFLRK